MSFANRVKPTSPVSSCKYFPTGGTNLYVGNLLRCVDAEPGIWTISCDALLATAFVANLYISGQPLGASTPPSVFLHKGKKLYFGTQAPYNIVVVAENTLLTATTTGTAQAVPIRPLDTGFTPIAAKSDCLTYECPFILSLTQSGVTDNPTNIDTTNQAGGTKYTQTYLGSEQSINVGLDLTHGDYATNRIMQDAKESAKLVFAALIAPGGFYKFGTAFVSRQNVTGTNKDIRRATYTIMMQDDAAEIIELSTETAFVQAQIAQMNQLIGV